MTFTKITLLLLVAAVAVMADDSPSYAPPQPRAYSPPSPSYDRPSEESYEDAKYALDWQVAEEGNNFGQQEQRDVDNTEGSYSVNLPDGRRQTVTYYVDGDSGFVADVTYSGEARYSEESQEYRPAYQPPTSAYDN